MNLGVYRVLKMKQLPCYITELRLYFLREECLCIYKMKIVFIGCILQVHGRLNSDPKEA